MCVRVCLRNRNPCVTLYLTLSLIGRSDCQKEIVANGKAHYKINLQLLLADNLFQLKWRHIRKFGIMMRGYKSQKATSASTSCPYYNVKLS